jgi:putative ABC transport system permease protein
VRDTRWRKVWRDLQLHPARTALVILAMVVGLAGAGSVLDTWALMRQVTREEYRASRPASATLRVDALDAALVADVRARPALAAVQARRTVNGAVRRSGETVTRSLVVFALDDFAGNRIGKVVAESGSWPPPDGALVLEHSSLEFSGIAEGDSVTVQVGDQREVVLPVTGVSRDVGLPPGWMEHIVYAFATSATLAHLGVPSTFNELQLVVRDSTLDRDAVRAVAYDVKRYLESRGRTVSNVDVPEPGQHQHAAQINSLLFTQGAFGVLALVLSGVLVVNLIAAMLAGQVREIGVMKAMGASSGQLAGMYYVMALLLGIVASAIAIPLAAFIGRTYADFTAELLNFSTTGFSIPPTAYALQLAVGLVFPLLAASVPVRRGCRISVGAALRDVGISAPGGPGSHSLFTRITTWLSVRGGVSRPLVFSLRNAFRRKQRMVLTLLTLAFGGAVFMGAGNLKAAVSGAMDLAFESQRFDMLLRLSRPVPVDSIERALATVGGVESAEAWGAVRANVDHGDGTLGNAVTVTGVPTTTRLLAHDVTEGRWMNETDDRVLIVSRRAQADEPSLRVGDSVMLALAGRVEPWHVIGSVDVGVSPAVYAPRASIVRLSGNLGADRIVVRSTLRGAPSQLELMQRLRSTLTDQGMTVQNGQMLAEARAVTEDHLLMVAGFLGIMGQLMIVVGGLALASTMGIAVLERTREIGVLRAIGARHGAIFSIVQVEGLVISLLGWLLAIPLSIPMSVMLGRAFGRIMMPVAVTWAPEMRGVAVWLAVAVSVSLVACAAPALRAIHTTTRSALEGG